MFTPHPPPSPYHWLSPFHTVGLDRYVERTALTDELLRAALGNVATILHGQEGCGKTSYLHAQITPALKPKAAQVLFFDNFSGNPLSNLGKLLLPIEQAAAASPSDQANPKKVTKGPWVLILDSLEDLFALHSQKTIDRFLNYLADILEQSQVTNHPEIHILLSVRSDFLPELLQRPKAERFGKLIIQAQKNIFELSHFNRDEAYFAMMKFAQSANLQLSPDLQKKIMRNYLSPAREIGTAQLQIILGKLHEDALARAAQSANPDALQNLTLERLSALGGMLGLTRRFMEDEVEWIANQLYTRWVIRLQRKQAIQAPQPTVSANESARIQALYRRALRLVLNSMVTCQHTACALSRRAILYRLMANQSGITRQMGNTILAGLLRRGLVICKPGEEKQYTLIHPVLTRQITPWFAAFPEENELRQAHDQTRKFLGEARTFSSTLSKECLQEISRFEERLGLDQSDLILIYRSALLQNVESLCWHKRLSREKIPTQPIIEALLSTTSHTERAGMAPALYKLGSQMSETLCKLLGDIHPQVRAAAIGALELLDPAGSWRSKLSQDCYIPAGEYPVGSKSGFFADEKIETRLKLNAFYISKYPVTNQDYALYLKDRQDSDNAPLGEENHPKKGLTWFEAREYCRWANARLPSEAEWETAASWDPNAKNEQGVVVGEKRRYPWGNQFDETKCNMRSGKLNYSTPVGKFSPQGDSAFGCADMAGNVWEWTNSLAKRYPYNPDDGREALAASGSRIIRGGSYRNGATYCTCTIRLAFDPFIQRSDIGFRYVLVIPDAETFK